MAFDSLTEKLQNIFKNLRSKGRLTEDDVKEALKEIKRALLAADVNFKVVKDFIGSVQERAIGQDVMNGLNPGQMVVKIVNEELVRLMGSETTEIAKEAGISRQGVHDLVRRCSQTLAGYEEKLHLVSRFMTVKEKVQRINELLEGYQEQDTSGVMLEIRRISDEIIEEL